MPSCAPNGALRASTGCPPYCSRRTLASSLRPVSAVSVQDSSGRPPSQADTMPSLMAGRCAARIGSTANGVSASTSEPASDSSNRARSSVAGRRMTIAIATAGPVRNPAGCTA